MKNISLVIFILFNYFIIQNFFDSRATKITNEASYQKIFNELVEEDAGPIYKNNIMENKKEVIYLY